MCFLFGEKGDPSYDFVAKQRTMLGALDKHTLLQFGHVLQTSLFPRVEEELGTLSDRARLLTGVLALVPLAAAHTRNGMGRPAKDRAAMAAAFLAKAVHNCATTRQLLDLLKVDGQMRRLCGWRSVDQLPHEATFSRAFAEFARTQLPQRMHEAIIKATQGGRLIGHISRDSTAIEARERFPFKREKTARTRKRKSRRRPKRAKAADRGTQTQRQRKMTLDAMLAEIPTGCGIGTKKSSKGHQSYWRGFKLHLDVADGQIPISMMVTSANVHDAVAAIPLMTMTAQRVVSCYDVMDSAYDADAILEHCRALGHVPIVQPHPRRNGRSRSKLPNVAAQAKRAPEMTWAQRERFKERTAVERVNSRLKDEFGARNVRVRGYAKVFAHLAFGVLALTVDQLIKLTG